MIQVQVGEYTTQIEQSKMIAPEFEVDFDGALLVLIENTEDGFVITNAMDGYGYNQREKYKNVKPVFIAL